MGIDLNFIAIEEPRPIFDRMSGGQEFDVAEYSSPNSCSVRQQTMPLCSAACFPVALLSPRFHCDQQEIRNQDAQGSEGKRVGVRCTPWTRRFSSGGFCNTNIGVDCEKIQWVQGAVNHAGSHGDPHVACRC